MSSPQKPSLILIPGAFHGPEIWSKLSGLLSAPEHNFTHIIPITLPTTTSDPSASLATDIAAVRSTILAELRADRPVVLVCHSFYGSAVGCSAVNGLTAPAASSISHVLGVVLLAGGFLPSNTTFLAAIGGSPPPNWRIDDAREFVSLDAVQSQGGFYHDLPLSEEREEWAGKLRKMSMKAFTAGGESVFAGWKSSKEGGEGGGAVKVWYVLTTEDRALPAGVQKMFIEGARSQGADITIREVESGHSPMLSRASETAAVVAEAVDAFVG